MAAVNDVDNATMHDMGTIYVRGGFNSQGNRIGGEQKHYSKVVDASEVLAAISENVNGYLQFYALLGYSKYTGNSTITINLLGADAGNSISKNDLRLNDFTRVTSNTINNVTQFTVGSSKNDTMFEMVGTKPFIPTIYRGYYMFEVTTNQAENLFIHFLVHNTRKVSEGQVGNGLAGTSIFTLIGT